ncbi:MAG TPA: hypothetical protein VGX76_20865, partial [Pirellulales bacterium]|nr:hypothetical protein [Pirellulales bacterium]
SAAPGNCTPAIEGFTLRQALRTRAFWVFGLAICVVAVVTSGQSLFNESVLKLQDFPVQAFYDLMVLSGTVGMVVKLPVGWLARFLPLGRMQAAGLLMMAACLCWLPRIHEPWELTVYAVGMGVAGTITTVLFFMVWGQAFGRAHLGEIQGVAQMLTLVASACGPSLLSRCLEHTGSYALVFQVQAAAAAVLAAASWRVWVPRPDDAPRLQEAGSVRAMPETALSIE